MNRVTVPVLSALVCWCLALPAPAGAAEFSIGDIEGSFNSELSIGASWRLDEIDPGLVTPGNWPGGQASSNTADDGNLNFLDGKVYSLIFKGVHDLELRYENMGVFLRGKYWYDHELENGSRPHGNLLNQYVPNQELNDSDFNKLAKSSGIFLLDAFFYANLTIFDNVPLDFRIGRQVLSWGESTFIQNGINSINPVDVSAFRRPGAEIKEGLLPVSMISFAAGVTESLSVETFYQLDWERTVIDGCGTYFSQTDPAAQGCNGVTLDATLPDRVNYANGLFITRTPDDTPDDGGQWGIALRYFAENLNFSEFGLYYLNLHSRTPFFSGVVSANPTLPDGSLGPPDGNPDFAPFIPGNPFGGNPQYTIDYPEDQKIFGATFATNVAGFALSGEVSYRPDAPVQLNTVDLLQGAVGLAPWSPVTPRVLATPPGGTAQGYDDFDVLQWQFTVVKFFEQVLGANRLSLVAEVGGNRVSSLPPPLTATRYGRSPIYGTPEFDPIPLASLGIPVPGDLTCQGFFPPPPLDQVLDPIVPNINPNYCTTDGLVTDTSWGYRIRGSLTYNDAFAGINLTPTFAWSHDVDGYSPNTNFNEGSKAWSIGLNAEYLNRYTASVSYTDFSGGDYNTQKDRDFLSVSFGLIF
ncbi:MAG: DUF1302 domain-containing protein [Gammaproteobacteria bacterium]|jgi:hypothetical protein